MTDINANGVRLNYQYMGNEGPVVVFCHGLVMDNLSSWYFTLAHKVAGFAQVILYDLRGHGLSERPKNGYCLQDMILDLESLLSQLAKDKKVHLVGNSFGGLLALQFALQYPNRVSSLALIDSLLNAKGWSQEMIKTLQLEGNDLSAMIAKSFKNWLGRHSKKKSTRLAKTAKAIVYGTSLIEDIKRSQVITEGELGKISCPVMLIYGENSDVRQAGEDLYRWLPDANLKILPRCTHSVIWEATDKVQDIVANWLLDKS